MSYNVALWSDTDGGKPKYSEENLTHASSTVINPSWTGLEFNSSLHDEKPGLTG
jgi:hypothetical protein